MLVLILAMSALAICASAADEATLTAKDRYKCLNFDVNSAGWTDFEAVLFYVYEQESGEAPIAWGSKKLAGQDTGDGIWSFDPAAFNLDSSKQYAILFVNKKSGSQTYNLLFDSSCIGDLAYCTGKEWENDVDSNKTSLEAKWKSSPYGPQKMVTSIGNITGETIPAKDSAYDLFVSFLKDRLSNARQYANKSDQQLIDDTAKSLGIGSNDVEAAISEAGVNADWSKGSSSLSADSDSSAKEKGPAIGSGKAYYTNDDGSKDNTTSSGSSSTGSSSTGSGGGSGSGSSSKSGSASNTQTGQEENILFIMLGVMVIAAGVIFFVRKKERA